VPIDEPIASSSSRSSDELEKLLSLAEGLQERCDSVDRRVDMYRLIQMLLVAGAVTAVILLIVSAPNFRVTSPTFSIVRRSELYLYFVATCFIYAIGGEYWIRRIKRRNYPDRFALTRLLELIHEVESAVARSQNWSPLDRAQFQIRLSRLTIGA
jgi:hypothetical protein